MRCDPLGFLYLGKEIELDQVEIINDDPRSEGRMVHIVHLDILNQPDPAAAREQFLLFFHKCGMDGPTFWDDKNPISSMIAAEKAMSKLKMRTAARLMHSMRRRKVTRRRGQGNQTTINLRNILLGNNASVVATTTSKSHHRDAHGRDFRRKR
jgi:hypothetical protein